MSVCYTVCLEGIFERASRQLTEDCCMASCWAAEKSVLSRGVTGGMEQGDSEWRRGVGVKNTPVTASSEVCDSQRSLGFFQALGLLFSRL